MLREWMFLFSLLFGCYHVGLSQNTPDLKGRWLGKITHINGEFSDEYDFELYIANKGQRYTGRTYVEVPSVLAVMSFTGVFRAKIFYIDEEELLYSRKPEDMSWCFKNMQLRLVKHGEQWHLEGPWQGSSKYGNCQPGWISLKKAVPKV